MGEWHEPIPFSRGVLETNQSVGLRCAALGPKLVHKVDNCLYFMWFLRELLDVGRAFCHVQATLTTRADWGGGMTFQVCSWQLVQVAAIAKLGLLDGTSALKWAGNVPWLD